MQSEDGKPLICDRRFFIMIVFRLVQLTPIELAPETLARTAPLIKASMTAAHTLVAGATGHSVSIKSNGLVEQSEYLNVMKVCLRSTVSGLATHDCTGHWEVT